MFFQTAQPLWDGLVVNVLASLAVGRGFAPRPCHTKNHHKHGTNCRPAWHGGIKDNSLAVVPDCVKGRVVCETIYGDIHLKDIMGSIARVGYCIPVPDFYLVLYGLRWR